MLEKIKDYYSDINKGFFEVYRNASYTVEFFFMTEQKAEVTNPMNWRQFRMTIRPVREDAYCVKADIRKAEKPGSANVYFLKDGKVVCRFDDFVPPSGGMHEAYLIGAPSGTLPEAYNTIVEADALIRSRFPGYCIIPDRAVDPAIRAAWPHLTPFETIVFDLTRSLISFDPVRAVKPFTEDPRIIQEVCTQLFFSAEWHWMNAGLVTEEEFLRAVLPNISSDKVREAARQVFDTWHEHAFAPTDGMEEVVRNLKNAGKDIYLISDFSPRLAEGDHWKKLLPYAELFDGAVIWDGRGCSGEDLRDSAGKGSGDGQGNFGEIIRDVRDGAAGDFDDRLQPLERIVGKNSRCTQPALLETLINTYFLDRSRCFLVGTDPRYYDKALPWSLVVGCRCDGDAGVIRQLLGLYREE